MSPLPRTASAAAGFTLVDVLLVVAILSMFAAIALPTSKPLDAARLDVAAQETANALRWARSEAIRNGSVLDTSGTRIVGFDVSTTTNHVRVSDYSGYARGSNMAHPIDKKTYDLDLANDSATRGVTVTSATFINQAGAAAGSTAIFDADGNPYQYNIGGTPAAVSPLTSAVVVLAYNGATRTVTLESTGRVVVAGG